MKTNWKWRAVVALTLLPVGFLIGNQLGSPAPVLIWAQEKKADLKAKDTPPAAKPEPTTPLTAEEDRALLLLYARALQAEVDRLSALVNDKMGVQHVRVSTALQTAHSQLVQKMQKDHHAANMNWDHGEKKWVKAQ